jgi:hypothetical protein
MPDSYHEPPNLYIAVGGLGGAEELAPHEHREVALSNSSPLWISKRRDAWEPCASGTIRPVHR